MRLSALRIVTLTLGCFTVATLVATAALIRTPPAADDPSPVTVRAVVDGFVAATNAAIATGESDAFDGVLTEDFVLHAEATGIGADRAAFAHYLAGLGDAFPGLALVPVHVTADGGLVVLRLTWRGSSASAIAGLPVGPTPIPGNDLAALRLTGRRIAEMWGFISLPAVDPLATVTTRTLGAGSVVGAARVTYAPDAGDQRKVLTGPLIVWLEHGVLRAAVDGPVDVVRAGAIASTVFAPALPGDEVELRAGDILVVPALTWHTLRNDGTVPAEAYAVPVLPTTAVPWSPTYPSPPMDGSTTGQWPASPPPGVSVEWVAGGTVPSLPAGELQVALARIRLAPGMGLALRPGPWAAIIVAEAGSLHLATDGSESRRLAPGQGALVAGDGGGPGSSPRASDGGTMTSVDAEPVTVLVMSVVPAYD